MAYGRQKKTEEHAFRRIEKDIKAGKLPRVVLLCGPERFLVDFYVGRLSSLFVEESVRMMDLVTLEGDSLSVQSIIESCETVSFLSPRKVVLVPDFPPADGRKLKGFPDSDLDRLTAYIGDEKAGVPEGTLLIFTGGEADGRKVPKLRKAISESGYGTVYDFQPLDDDQLRGFIDKRLRSSGRKYRPSIISAIISECGYGNKYVDYSLYSLDNDLKKLIALAGEEISPDDVRTAITSNPENNVFRLLDCVARNRKGGALMMLQNLIDAKEEPFRIQSMIVQQLEMMLIAKEMTETGCSMKDIQAAIRRTDRYKRPVSEYRLRKAMGVAGGVSYETLRHMLSGAYEIDRNVKHGVFDPRLALEYYISNN